MMVQEIVIQIKYQFLLLLLDIKMLNKWIIISKIMLDFNLINILIILLSVIFHVWKIFPV
jgi:hypothetical protein